MKITLLVDKQDNSELQSEFGLALLLEDENCTFLFDTGAESALSANGAKLNIPAGKFRKVILSHGHYDHTGGLAQLAPEVIYCCKNVAQSHYSYHSADDIHNIAMPENARAVLNASNVVYVEKFTEIAPGWLLSGPIPRVSNEDCGGKFFHDHACTLPDTVDDEQALLTNDGVLISGCCHAGVINTILYCQQCRPDIKIHTVIGGLHLRSASAERLQQTADFFRQSGVKKLILMHCTGSNAISELQKLLPECSVIQPQLGDSWFC